MSYKIIFPKELFESLSKRTQKELLNTSDLDVYREKYNMVYGPFRERLEWDMVIVDLDEMCPIHVVSDLMHSGIECKKDIQDMKEKVREAEQLKDSIKNIKGFIGDLDESK